MSKIIKFWKTFSWGLLIFILSTISSDEVKKISIVHIPHLDKIMHASFYAVFAFLMVYDFNNSYENKKYSKSIWITILITAFYGFLMEMLQNYIFTSRDADIFDMMANITGIAIGIIAFIILRKRMLKN